MADRLVREKRSPYRLPGSRGSASSFTVGTEASDVINVAVALKDIRGQAITTRERIRCWLATSATGAVLATPPTGGIAAGTNGTLIPGADHLRDGVHVKGTLVIDAVPEKFKTTTTAYYRIQGVQYSKAAATAIAFTAAHVVAATKYGIVLVQVNAAGTVSTKVPAATATTPMTYTSAALALAALPLPDVGKIMLGYITLNNSASDGSSSGAWVAQTDDMTNTSDITAAAFVDATEQIGPVEFDVIPTAAGLFDINITDTAARTVYLALRDASGQIGVSGAITFA